MGSLFLFAALSFLPHYICIVLETWKHSTNKIIWFLLSMPWLVPFILKNCHQKGFFLISSSKFPYLPCGKKDNSSSRFDWLHYSNTHTTCKAQISNTNKLISLISLIVMYLPSCWDRNHNLLFLLFFINKGVSWPWTSSSWITASELPNTTFFL